MMNRDSRGRVLIIRTACLTFAIELLTCLLRFGARLESTRDTASTIGVLTGGLRIHHSYAGVALLLPALLLESRQPRLSAWLTAIGLGLFFSDLIHHFVVLWIVVGNPQFDLFY
ncbi:MAG: hypothetical protein KDA96_24210 [Planctomycetaceae bacterium]|nr:hypothetical protein [Planctomycetaceae bacterium]